MTYRISPPPAPKAAPPDPKRGALRAKLLAARLELADREVRSRVVSDRLLRWLYRIDTPTNSNPRLERRRANG